VCMINRCMGDLFTNAGVPLCLFAAVVACGCLSWCHPFIRMWQEQ
jgi:hypothetical protein